MTTITDATAAAHPAPTWAADPSTDVAHERGEDVHPGERSPGECKPPLLDSPVAMDEVAMDEVAWVAREARALMEATDDEPRCARFLVRKRALTAYIETTTARRLTTALTPCRGSARRECRRACAPVTAVRFRASDDLPAGVHVALLQGETEVVWLLDRASDLDVVCAALSQAATEHASRSWVYVGDVQDEMRSA